MSVKVAILGSFSIWVVRKEKLQLFSFIGWCWNSDAYTVVKMRSLCHTYVQLDALPRNSVKDGVNFWVQSLGNFESLEGTNEDGVHLGIDVGPILTGHRGSRR